MGDTVKTTEDFPEQLGKKVRHKISGFEGTVVGKSFYLSGCIRYIVLAYTGAKEEPKEYMFDEAELEYLPAPEAEVEQQPTGGPRDRKPPTR